jgi:hypothetical protein
MATTMSIIETAAPNITKRKTASPAFPVGESRRRQFEEFDDFGLLLKQLPKNPEGRTTPPFSQPIYTSHVREIKATFKSGAVFRRR